MSEFEWSRNDGGPSVCIELEGERVHLPAERSLLAGLLAAGRAEPDFFCAIGQCQRCLLRINGSTRPACLVQPSEGDVIERPAGTRR